MMDSFEDNQPPGVIVVAATNRPASWTPPPSLGRVTAAARHPQRGRSLNVHRRRRFPVGGDDGHVMSRASATGASLATCTAGAAGKRMPVEMRDFEKVGQSDQAQAPYGHARDAATARQPPVSKLPG